MDLRLDLMRRLVRAARAIDRFNTALGRGAAWLLLAMVLIGAYNAVARFVERDFGLRLSSNALLELQWYLFGVVFLLGAPLALRLGDHVRVDVICSGLSPRGRAWLELVGTLVLLLPFCACAIWISFDFVADSWASREWSNDPGGLPRWPIKPLVPIGFALLLLQGAAEAIKAAARLAEQREPGGGPGLAR